MCGQVFQVEVDPAERWRCEPGAGQSREHLSRDRKPPERELGGLWRTARPIVGDGGVSEGEGRGNSKEGPAQTILDHSARRL